jgi:hypothetical protein
MRRPVRLILAVILLITCSGCLWVPGRGWHGDHDRGRHGDHDSGRHNDSEERH